MGSQAVGYIKSPSSVIGPVIGVRQQLEAFQQLLLRGMLPNRRRKGCEISELDVRVLGRVAVYRCH